MANVKDLKKDAVIQTARVVVATYEADGCSQEFVDYLRVLRQRLFDLDYEDQGDATSKEKA